jgi:hypothetical protein
MGINPDRVINDKLLVRPLPVNGDLNDIKNYYSNRKDTILNPSSKLTIYYLNVRGLGNKMGEFEIHVLPLHPQIICLTEHHLSNLEADNISISRYILGAFYCRPRHKFGGVNILVHESLIYSNIDVNRYCHDYDLETCALKVNIRSVVYCIVYIYRPPAGDLSNFLTRLDSLLVYLHLPSINLIVCGDININYLQSSSSRNQLDSLMALYNLYGIVNFPTRITDSTSTAIDNFFIDKGKNVNYSISPIYNGLSDHDAQLLVLNEVTISNHNPYSIRIQLINESTIAQFKLNLTYVSWAETFTDDNIDTNFKNFLYTYLRIFNCTFPYKRIY